MKITKLLPIALAGLLLAACADYRDSPKATVGALGGAALGGWAGSNIGNGSGQLAATAAGALIGAVLGYGVGESLDRVDRLYAERTAYDALEHNPSGATSGWSNPDTGHHGTITPAPAYQTATGQYCREYQTTITVGGHVQEGYGTACRQPDGSWQIVG